MNKFEDGVCTDKKKKMSGIYLLHRCLCIFSTSYCKLICTLCFFISNSVDELNENNSKWIHNQKIRTKLKVEQLFDMLQRLSCITGSFTFASLLRSDLSMFSHIFFLLPFSDVYELCFLWSFMGITESNSLAMWTCLAIYEWLVLYKYVRVRRKSVLPNNFSTKLSKRQ